MFSLNWTSVLKGLRIAAWFSLAFGARPLQVTDGALLAEITFSFVTNAFVDLKRLMYDFFF